MSERPRATADDTSEPHDSETGRGTAGDERHQDERRRDRADAGESAWFAETAVRAGLAIIGIVLLIFALGQAVGLDLLGLFVDALSSPTGRWLVVAFFALLLIVAAQRGFSRRR